MMVRENEEVGDDAYSTEFDRVMRTIGDGLKSRREFMENSAKVGGSALALGLTGTGTAMATGGDEGNGNNQGNGGNGSGENGNGQGTVTDVEVLNYALTLEKLEATFYTEGQEMFSEGEFERTESAQLFEPDTVQYSTYDFFNRIRDHEQAHVDAITKVINQLGGEPVSGLQFEFPYQTIEEYVTLAQTFESLGVSAYDGAIDLIKRDKLLTAAATIATVEGRHSSYLNLVNRKVPFPRAFDQPKSMEEVTQAASQFIVSTDN
jgi:rubrerythrin